MISPFLLTRATIVRVGQLSGAISNDACGH